MRSLRQLDKMHAWAFVNLLIGLIGHRPGRAGRTPVSRRLRPPNVNDEAASCANVAVGNAAYPGRQRESEDEPARASCAKFAIRHPWGQGAGCKDACRLR